MVVATLLVLGSQIEAALAAGVVFLVLELGTNAAEARVGAYAGNAILGAVLVGFAGWVAWTGGLILAAGGALVGGWFSLRRRSASPIRRGA